MAIKKLLAWLGLTLTAMPGLVYAGVMDDGLTPFGQLFDIEGHKMHIYCEGEQGPVIILDAGIGGFSLEWIPLQRLLSGQVKICAYDRSGYGWSEPGPSPRTTDQINGELHELLLAAGLPPPYILVGHSFGGFNMQYYAKVYPDETAGIILVDSSHPEQTERLPDLPARREKSKSSETVTFFNGQSTLDYYPEDVRTRLMRIMSLRKTFITHNRESANFSISGAQVLDAGPLPDIPLVVISRGKRVWPDDPYGDNLEATWHQMQRELAGLTPTGIQIIARDSGHLIHLEQPQLVAEVILSMVNRIRETGAMLQQTVEKNIYRNGKVRDLRKTEAP